MTVADDTLRTLVRAYYTAWARGDRDQARAQLDDSLDFRSPEDRFTRADDFLGACWRYSEGLTGVAFLREVYAAHQAFVVLRWESADGSSFVGAEYLRVESGKIREILVVNNTAGFADLFR